MHTFGRRFEVTVAEPNGTTRCLLALPRWDRRWEEMFFFAGEGVVVPAGSTVSVKCTWDNPTSNVVNYGPTLDDEMCDVAILTSTPRP